ncbi:hypothetical protein EMCRGX_G032541 [Ephydatia muelleri]
MTRQGLAIRGDGDEMDSNFHQLLILKGFDDVTIHALLAKKQDKYTSPQIQRAVTDNGTIYLRDIALSIREAKYFTIMADEVTDASNREQVVVCFRWVDSDFEPHEDFVGLHKICNCRGQCYDGAANMAGSRTGTANNRQVEERAIFTHCYGHALNLAVADVVKESRMIDEQCYQKAGDGQGTFLETVQDYFRAEYYVVIDAALACIRQRFDQPGYQTYRHLENLLHQQKWNRLNKI